MVSTKPAGQKPDKNDQLVDRTCPEATVRWKWLFDREKLTQRRGLKVFILGAKCHYFNHETNSLGARGHGNDDYEVAHSVISTLWYNHNSLFRQKWFSRVFSTQNPPGGFKGLCFQQTLMWHCDTLYLELTLIVYQVIQVPKAIIILVHITIVKLQS